MKETLDLEQEQAVMMFLMQFFMKGEKRNAEITIILPGLWDTSLFLFFNLPILQPLHEE